MKKVNVKKQIQEAQLKQQSEQNKKMEDIVINAHEKVLPILKKHNLLANDSKMICDTLAIAVMQGQYKFLKEHKVEDVKLLDYIQKEYPHYEAVVEIITAVNELSMEYGIEVLQWMTEKIKKTIEDRSKDVTFEELGLDF